MLLLATLFWGVSFPVMKAVGMLHQRVLASDNTWFPASSLVVVRFGVATLIMLAWSWRSLARFTRLEWREGVGLGVCCGLGMILQVDGLAYTSASVSAFLTECCCLILPWVVAVRDRRWPSFLMVICSLLAAAGVAVLANVDWRHFRVGRGELETLISSAIFAAQVLWLERPLFARNRVSHFTLAMFLTMTLIALPAALFTMRQPADWANAYSSPAVLALIGVLVLFCTMIAFVLMNRWQPLLPAPEAGLVYAAEPVFASLFALFLPAGLSRLGEIRYPNEKVTLALFIGGGLITLANVLIQWSAARAALRGSAARSRSPGDPVSVQ
jgi:drug/metabolite transporter (DMT)-like permease